MASVYLASHNDDECLWGSFLILKHEPDVIVCLRSFVQEDRGTGIDYFQRENETDCALDMLGGLTAFSWEQWEFPDRAPVWPNVWKRGHELRERYDHCFSPAVEVDGHEQHSAIGRMADDVFGVENVTHYLTYTRTAGRSTWGTEVIPEPEWIERKLRALACYSSQIREPSTRPWFYDQLDMREWISP